MFDNMFQSYVDQIRPLARSTAEECRTFGYRVLSRLDAILEQLQTETFEEDRLTFPGQVSGTPVDLLTVPQGEEWAIESVTLNGSSGAFLLGESANMAAAVGSPIPRWAKQLGNTQVIETYPVQGAILTAGTRLWAVTTNGMVADFRVSVKVKRQSHTPAMRAVPGGQGGPALDGGYDATRPEPGRHTGDWAQNK